ncbi:MAG: hypothetical protein AB8D78_06390 [Akkermansiaceae bacterium]
MPALTAYSNTENTALVILQRKGYQVWFDQDTESFWCEKDGWDFSASGATELLGAVAFREYHEPKEFKEYWWRIEEPWLLNNLPSEPQPFEPVWKRRDD